MKKIQYLYDMPQRIINLKDGMPGGSGLTTSGEPGGTNTKMSVPFIPEMYKANIILTPQEVKPANKDQYNPNDKVKMVTIQELQEMIAQETAKQKGMQQGNTGQTTTTAGGETNWLLIGGIAAAVVIGILIIK